MEGLMLSRPHGGPGSAAWRTLAALQCKRLNADRDLVIKALDEIERTPMNPETHKEALAYVNARCDLLLDVLDTYDDDIEILKRTMQILHLPVSGFRSFRYKSSAIKPLSTVLTKRNQDPDCMNLAAKNLAYLAHSSQSLHDEIFALRPGDTDVLRVAVSSFSNPRLDEVMLLACTIAVWEPLLPYDRIFPVLKTIVQYLEREQRPRDDLAYACLGCIDDFLRNTEVPDPTADKFILDVGLIPLVCRLIPERDLARPAKCRVISHLKWLMQYGPDVQRRALNEGALKTIMLAFARFPPNDLRFPIAALGSLLVTDTRNEAIKEVAQEGTILPNILEYLTWSLEDVEFGIYDSIEEILSAHARFQDDLGLSSREKLLILLDLILLAEYRRQSGRISRWFCQLIRSISPSILEKEVRELPQTSRYISLTIDLLCPALCGTSHVYLIDEAPVREAAERHRWVICSALLFLERMGSLPRPLTPAFWNSMRDEACHSRLASAHNIIWAVGVSTVPRVKSLIEQRTWLPTELWAIVWQTL